MSYDEEVEPLVPHTVDILNEETLEEEYARKRKESRNTLLGMVCVAVATAFVCTVGAIVQDVKGSILQLMLGRYILQNLLSWFIWVCKRPATCTNWYGDPPNRANIWTRGICYFILVFCWWRGLELVPIGDAEAILFVSPIITVIVARLVLKEKLPKAFPLSCILTLVGIVFICQPAFIFGGSDYRSISLMGLLFLIGCNIAWTIVCILVRTAKTAHWLQLELVSSCQAAWLWTPLLILCNRLFFHSVDLSGGGWDFSWQTLGVIVLIAIMGFSGLMLNVIGYQIGDATKVAWMEYLDLVFAFLYQWFVFGIIPNSWEIVGASLLFSTCIIHLCEEWWNWNQHTKNYKKRKLQEQQLLQYHSENLNTLNNANMISLTKFDDILKQEKEQKKINMMKKNENNNNNNNNDAKKQYLHELDQISPTSSFQVKKLSNKDKFMALVERLTVFSSDGYDDHEYEQIHK